MKIVSVETMRLLERKAIDAGIPEYRLMRRAGTGAAEIIEKFSAGRFRRAVFFCGGGNNAGDAVVAAGSLKMPHVLLPFRDLSQLKGAAAEAFREFGPVLNICPPELFDPAPGDVIVDALLGIGFTGDRLREPVAGALQMISRIGAPVIAFDLPSGLDGDTGTGAAGTVPADLTITFGVPKQGLFLNDGPEYAGKITVVPIGVGSFDVSSALPYSFFAAPDARALMPKTPLNAHKNSRGRVLLLCGSTTYPGAAALAAAGALYFSGLVRLVTVESPQRPSLPAALISRLLPPGPGGSLPPEALQSVPEAIEASDILCAGCGWGSCVSTELLKSVLAFPGKAVLDADALNLLSQHPELWNGRSETVLTPHPGEAFRLGKSFGIDTELPREELASALARKLGAVVVLKGFHTCISTPDGLVSLNGSGGPELAMAGSGDVLAGMIAALGSRLPNLADAARLGVFLHGAAGDAGRGAVIADELPALAARTAACQTWW